MSPTTRTQTWLLKEEARANSAMVATKDPAATEAGLQMLELGGNAVDAAVAACFSIGVVEPSSSGIGGGGYLVYQVEDHGGAVGFPMQGSLAARPDLYRLTGDQAVGSFGWAGVEGNENLEGPRSICVPGAVAGLCEVHRRFGRLPLREVISPAVRLARDGFLPNWYYLHSLGNQAAKLFKYAELRKIFMPGNEMPTGDLINRPLVRQPDLATVLETIGKKGPEAFYIGEIAEAIVSDVQNNGGILSMKDMASYRPYFWEGGLEINYRDSLVRLPPYACAGITSAMTLRFLENTDVRALGHNTADMLHAYICSARLAYIDRFDYLADPNFVDVPWNGLLSDSYIQRRWIQATGRASLDFEPGDPWIEEGRRPKSILQPSRPAVDNGTTHLCVIDKDGNAVSLTNTIMAGFGSGVVPKTTGVVMNNGMMWFDPVPGRVNSIGAGKFPLNNMTPALVLGKRGVKIAVGASGGRYITNCVTQIITKMLDFELGPQEAIDAPRVDCSQPWTCIDHRIPAEIQDTLKSMGHTLKPIPSGLLQSGFTSFASPAAILRESSGTLRAGVDTFHSAYAAGL